MNRGQHRPPERRDARDAVVAILGANGTNLRNGDLPSPAEQLGK
jgi:hypothetical protein